MSTTNPHDPHHHSTEHPAPHTPEVHEAPDAWHDHAADERPQHAHLESINAPKVTGVGLSLFLAVAATVLIVYGFYVWYGVRTFAEHEGPGMGLEGPAIAQREELKDKLTKGYVWANHNAALLPLDQGIEKVVQQYAGKRAEAQPVAPSAPVTVAPPAPTRTPTGKP